MTLKFMEGFDTCASDSDFRTRGWVNPPSPQRAAFSPSITSISGNSLRLIGAGNASTQLAGSSGEVDLGYFNTGVTVNQAWTAGGFTFGWAGKFNSGTAAAFGGANGLTTSVDGVCFDGALYWAIRNVSTTYSLCSSPDLINWTAATTQPVALSASMGVQYVSGALVIVGNATSTASQTMYYSNNGGISWTTVTLGTTSAGSGPNHGYCIATGNSTYPHAVVVDCVTNFASFANATNIYVGNFTTGSMALALNFSVTSTTGSTTPVIRNINGTLCALHGRGTGSIVATALANSASLNTSAAWTQTTLSNVGLLSDIRLNSAGTTFVFSGAATAAANKGLFTTANTGTSSVPALPGGTLTCTQTFSTAAVQRMVTVGSSIFALGAAGYIATSTDGTNWTTPATTALLGQGSAYSWQNVLYDGAQYVLFSDSTSGVIATTPDMLTNYNVKYVMDGTESNANSASNPYGNTAVYAGSAPVSTTGLFTNTGRVAIGFSALASGSRNCLCIVAGNATGATTVAMPTAGTQLSNYFELVATPSSTVNSFIYTVYINGTQAMTGAGNALATTTDTTALLILVPNRNGILTGYDDMYFCLNDGQGISGQQGVISVVAQRPTTDVQDQWTKTGSAASNALSVNQTALSSLSTNYVSSQNSGDKDIYSSSQTVPAGYSVKAVQAEGYFTKTSTTSPVVNIGLLSGGTESDGSSATLTTQNQATYVSQLWEKAPAGTAWSTSTAQAAQIVLNHVT